MDSARQTASPAEPAPTPAKAPEHHKLRALKWFYLHATTNTMFMQCTLGGSLFALYMKQLGLNVARIGLLISLFPFMQMLSLGTAAVVERIGYRRSFLLFYGSRKLTVMVLAAAPWVLAATGMGWTFAFVAACLVLFGIQRSLGETGFYPWMKEFVPDAVRGRAQGTATVLGSLAAGAGMGLVSWLVGNRDALHLGRFGPFQLAYLVFAGAGLLGVLGTSRLPGGHAPQRARPSAGGSGFARRLTASLRDRRFAAFLLATGILQGSMVLFAGLMPLYMNDIVGLAERHVVLLSIAQMGGAVTAGFVCGRAADRYGSRRMLFLLLGAMAMMPALWAALPLLGVARTVAAYAAYLLFGTSLVGANIAAIRMMYNSVVPDAKKTEYLAVRYALVGLVAGTMPLLAGHSVEAFAPLTGKKLLGLPLNPYLPLFACCAVAWVGCAMIFARIHDNPRHAARPSDQTI